VKIYSLTRAGRKQLHEQAADWRRATDIVERFFRIVDTP
jgi:DNA-binding PadR family transcriptional regulator